MGYAIDIVTFGELIEDFLVTYFDDIEVAGSVKAREEGNINFVQIDLSFLKNWDQDSEKLTQDIHLYLNSLFKSKPLDLYYMIKFKNLTLDVKTKDTSHYLSKTLQLFYTDQRIKVEPKGSNKVLLYLRKNWQIFTTVVVTLLIATYCIDKLNQTPEKKDNFVKAIEQVNLFAGIIGAFVLSYVLTKVLVIRQEKLARVANIRELSYKLTCFRKICYHLRKDHRFWNGLTSYDYAQKISKLITHDDARFPDYDNDAKYANYKSLIITERHNTAIIMFYLQLYMFAGEEFEHNASLAWGSYPPFLIYSHEQIVDYLSFLEYDEFWNSIDNNNIKFSYNHHKFHIDPIEKAAANYNLAENGDSKFSEKMILRIASDVQNKIIPELYHLTRLNEEQIPLVIRYLITVTSAMMVFSVIYPVIASVLTDNFVLLNLNVLIILALIIDIILRLPSLITSETTLKIPDDYR